MLSFYSSCTANSPQLVEPINSLAMIAYLYIMLIFVMHYREYDADKTASKFVGIKTSMKH